MRTLKFFIFNDQARNLDPYYTKHSLVTELYIAVKELITVGEMFGKDLSKGLQYSCVSTS